MKRRQFVTACMGLATTSLATNALWLGKTGAGELNLDELPGSILNHSQASAASPGVFFDPPVDREQPVIARAAAPIMDDRDAHTMTGSQSSPVIKGRVQRSGSSNSDKLIESAPPTVAKTNKSIDFAHDYDDDIYISEADKPLLNSVYKRLQRVQQTIGFGHFNLLSFDQALNYAKRYSDIGEFTQAELAFIENVFFTDASEYGFYGAKVTHQLTDQFKKSEVVKIPRSGHYILKNDSYAYYQKLTQDVGGSIILTSGIRSNIKQLYLFLAKTVRVKGNLSRASRSLAPPGYSYHGIGDFDVGRVGWGAKNFTDDFSSTYEFKKMRDLGYIAIRYDHGNDLGVRFEPWHIKVV